MSEERALEFINNAKLDLKTNWFLELVGIKLCDELAAADSYIKAANQYKIIDSYEKAAETFLLAVKIYKKKSKHNIVAAIVNAADCYHKAHNYTLAKKYYHKSIVIFEENSNFTNAAKYLKILASIYEEDDDDDDDVDTAIKLYKLASKYFKSSSMSHEHLNCMINIANIHIKENNYGEAFNWYESIANYYNKETILHFKYAEYCFNALICLLHGEDCIACEKTLEKYSTLNSTFKTTAEYSIISSIIQSFERGDIENFSRTTKSNTIYRKFKDWHHPILDKLQSKLEQQDNDEYDLC